MKELWKYVILGVSIVISVIILATAFTYRYRAQDTIVVTGLGETEFTSDLIVWEGTISVESFDKLDGYAQIEKSRKKVTAYIKSKGIPEEAVSFRFVNVDKDYESLYQNGNYVGQRFTGLYLLRQGFVVESNDVATVESISREISALITDGVNIEADMPQYYYTKLDDVKLSLIETASKDALMRAKKIADNAGAKIGRASSARIGVFQITGANSNEEYLSGGAFNTYSRDKKARITVRVEYKIR